MLFGYKKFIFHSLALCLSSGFGITMTAGQSVGEIVDPSTLDGKIMAGYQGWFMTPEDGGLDAWRHWSKRNEMPSSSTLRVAMWPDMREYEADELEPTLLHYDDLFYAGLFSSYNEKTVNRHLRWMQEYNIDGVFVQRFIGEAVRIRHVRDKVLENVQNGAEQYGRVFANMYDISGYDELTLWEDIKADWMHLVDNQLITQSPSYLHHNGLPVVSIWGFGFKGRPGEPADALDLIRWFQSPDTPLKYRATVKGGVIPRWRTDDSEWDVVYRTLDIVSPWTVGRMKNLDDVTAHSVEFWRPDLKECEFNGKDFMPVVYPGYSFHNSNPDKTFNEVPRLGGNLFWKQLRLAMDEGAKMIYVAMFDEVDEGTAIFKVAEDSFQVPNMVKFVNLNTDQALGYRCVPCDWYMSLLGNATNFLRAGQPMPEDMPPLPTGCPVDLPSMVSIFDVFQFFGPSLVNIGTSLINAVLPLIQSVFKDVFPFF